MENVFMFLPELIKNTLWAVVESLAHNWLPLSMAIIIAAVMQAHIDQEKVKQYIISKPKVSIWASVLFGAVTPFCACGTMAVIIGMLTTTLPWGPVMAFLTSSPLMSPDGFILLAGVISPTFAIALTISSIIIGLVAGYGAHLIEANTSYLNNQTYFAKAASPACGCASSASNLETACSCSAASPVSFSTWKKFTEDSPLGKYYHKLKLGEIGQSIVDLGLKQILFYFCIFIAVGYLIQSFVPTSLIMALFSSENIFAVPLAAAIGLPLYVTTESAVPLIKALMDAGASGGATLAFMITGQATSAWVIAGLVTFMKRRAITLYLAFIIVGGIALGYIYDLYLLIIK
jgi:uncharacterized membrane protein YraQ (UPF0718 family)